MEEWLQFRGDLAKLSERGNNLLTFFFLSYGSARILFLFNLCGSNFFLPTSACRKFFFFQNHPSPAPSKAKWSVPKIPKRASMKVVQGQYGAGA